MDTSEKKQKGECKEAKPSTVYHDIDFYLLKRIFSFVEGPQGKDMRFTLNKVMLAERGYASRTPIGDFVQSSRMWNWAAKQGCSGFTICNAIVASNGNLDDLLLAMSEGYSSGRMDMLLTAINHNRVAIADHFVTEMGVGVRDLPHDTFRGAARRGHMDILVYALRKSLCSPQMEHIVEEAAIHNQLEVFDLFFTIAHYMNMHLEEKVYLLALENGSVAVMAATYAMCGIFIEFGDTLVKGFLHRIVERDEVTRFQFEALVFLYKKGIGLRTEDHRLMLECFLYKPATSFVLDWAHTVQGFPFPRDHLLRLAECEGAYDRELARAAGFEVW